MPKNLVKNKMESLKYKKALIKVGYSCNNNCIYCHSKDLRNFPDLNLKQIIKKIIKAKEMGMEMIVFSGGEITLRNDFSLILKIVQSYGLKIGIITNGRMFAYKKFTEKVLNYPVEYIYLSLQSAEEISHNKQTETNSFKQTIKGIKNLQQKNVDLTINVVLNKNNENQLVDIYNFLFSFFVGRLKFSLLEPKGEALKNFQEISVSPDKATREICKVIKYSHNSKNKIIVGFDGFTPCLIGFKNYQQRRMDLFTDNFCIMSEVFEDNFFAVDYGKRSFADTCGDCAYKSFCPGIYSDYLQKYSDVLKPLLRAKPNSFVYFCIKEIKFKKSESCPLKNNLNNFNFNTQIMVKKNKKTFLYETNTKDFSTADIKKVKELQQIYINKTTKIKSINYGKDINKLSLLNICKSCVQKDKCPQIFTIIDENIFSKLEKNIKKEIYKLSGKICDIGAGEIPYLEIIKKNIKDKKIQEYIGIDPNLKNNQKNIKGIYFYKKNVEEFFKKNNYFDAVLILRSYNHFYNVKLVFNNLVMMLKKNGKMIIVDNGVYGVIHKNINNTFFNLRQEPEHFRNHISYEVISFLKHYPLKILKHYPIKFNTGNEWFLMLKKI